MTLTGIKSDLLFICIDNVGIKSLFCTIVYLYVFFKYEW